MPTVRTISRRDITVHSVAHWLLTRGELGGSSSLEARAFSWENLVVLSASPSYFEGRAGCRSPGEEQKPFERLRFVYSRYLIGIVFKAFNRTFYREVTRSVGQSRHLIISDVCGGFPKITHSISTEDASYRKRVSILDTNMAYVDVGEGDPIVFLHGNPTPSYLWRNIIPYLLPFGRCLAPDLVGMGNSGAAPDGGYRLVDHQRYLDAWFEVMGLKKNIILVVHDWGSALGFSWAQHHSEQVKAIVYMEGIVRPFLSWDEWPELTKAFFKAQRTPAGEDLILQKNLFIEYLLPLRGIPEEAIEVYRRYYRSPGASRLPMLTWTRELPIEGRPEDVCRIVDSYASWLAISPIPKLFINGDPSGFLIGPQREFCRAWPNQQEVTVKGAHFLQEECPSEVGAAMARFVAKVLARQVS